MCIDDRRLTQGRPRDDERPKPHRTDITSCRQQFRGGSSTSSDNVSGVKYNPATLNLYHPLASVLDISPWCKYGFYVLCILADIKELICTSSAKLFWTKPKQAARQL